METSTKPQLRSISLPSTLTPNSTRIKINLTKLQTLVQLPSSESNQSSFSCLVDLYLSFDELICTSRIQQVNHNNKLLIEDVLIRSTGLLDFCSDLLEFLALMKKNLRTLQSAFRRKGIAIHDPSGEGDHISDYVLYRKKAKKKTVEYLRSLQHMETEMESHHVSSEDHNLSTVIGVLREMVTATISVFRALLLCLSGKTKGFSLIAKLMPTSKSREIAKDADIIDLTLNSLRKNVKNDEGMCMSIDVQFLMERLLNLDHQIEGYEVGLDSLFRRLIQTRVSLLNILGN